MLVRIRTRSHYQYNPKPTAWAITLEQMDPQVWFICGPSYEPVPLVLADSLPK